MKKRALQVIRSGALVTSGIMFVYAGHLWNKIKVAETMLFWFDLMSILLFSFIAAMLMFDATEKRKNINILLLLTVGSTALLIMLNDPPKY